MLDNECDNPSGDIPGPPSELGFSCSRVPEITRYRGISSISEGARKRHVQDRVVGYPRWLCSASATRLICRFEDAAGRSITCSVVPVMCAHELSGLLSVERLLAIDNEYYRCACHMLVLVFRRTCSSRPRWRGLSAVEIVYELAVPYAVDVEFHRLNLWELKACGRHQRPYPSRSREEACLVLHDGCEIHDQC